jgi:hypothetical protein
MHSILSSAYVRCPLLVSCKETPCFGIRMTFNKKSLKSFSLNMNHLSSMSSHGNHQYI